MLPVCPCVVSFSKFHDPDTHDLLRTSSRGCHEDATRKTAVVEFKLYKITCIFTYSITYTVCTVWPCSHGAPSRLADIKTEVFFFSIPPSIIIQHAPDRRHCSESVSRCSSPRRRLAAVELYHLEGGPGVRQALTASRRTAVLHAIEDDRDHALLQI